MNRGPSWTPQNPTRVCRKCDTERPVEMFGWTQSRWGGKVTAYRSSYCRACEPSKFNRGPNWSEVRPTRMCRGRCGAEKSVECFGWATSRGRRIRASYCRLCRVEIARLDRIKHLSRRKATDAQRHRKLYWSDEAYRKAVNVRSIEYKRRVREGAREDVA